MNVESISRTPVRPIRPAAPYVGGKRNLSARLVDLIEATPHSRYCEPFVGMGGVFLRRRTRPRVEIINDWSADVANLFRILREHYPQFMEVLRQGHLKLTTIRSTCPCLCVSLTNCI